MEVLLEEAANAFDRDAFVAHRSRLLPSVDRGQLGAQGENKGNIRGICVRFRPRLLVDLGLMDQVGGWLR